MSFFIELFCVVTLQYQILVRIAIAYFIIEKRKLRHSLGRPSRSDFVQSEFGGMIINPILLKILFFLIKEVYINMDIRILRYFLTVAKEQNFTKAAEQLNITQPTLSRQLAAFEEELGTALFIRESRSITLTEAGILLKRRALEIIDLEEKSWMN